MAVAKANKDENSLLLNLCAVAVSVALICLFTLPFYFIVYLPFEREQCIGVRIDSAAATPINISSSTVTADWNISFSFKNDRQAVMYYHDIRALLFYDADQFLANTTLAMFYQSEGERTTMNAIFLARGIRVHNWAADAIDSDLRHGIIKFNVKLETLVTRINPAAGTSTKTLGSATVSCNEVKIKFSSEATAAGLQGKLDGGPSNCLIRLKFINHEEIFESDNQIS